MPEIIPVMEKLGYFPTETGVCFGIAVMGAQAVIREEPKVFYNRINRIHNLTNENIESILKKRELGKTDDLFHFFDGITIYHGLASVTEKVKKASKLAIPRQSIENKFLFKNHNDGIEKKENQNSKFNFVDVKERLICFVTIKDLSTLIIKLKSQSMNKAFSLIIHPSNTLHAVQLGFSNNNWLIVDHDFVEIHEESIDVNGIVKGLFSNLLPKKEDKLTAEIAILFSEHTDIDLSWIKKYELSSSQINELKADKKELVNLINSCAFANQHQILENIFLQVNIVDVADEIIFNKLPLALLLAEIGDSHIETTNLFLKKIKYSKLEMCKRISLLKGRAANEVDALFVAANLGYIKTVRAFLQAFEENDFSDDLRMSLLKANNNVNMSALYIAVYKRNTEVVRALLEAIQRAGFDKKKLFSLLEGKDRDGTSILSIAAKKGYMSITVALVQAIDNLSFSDEDKVTLLEGKNKKGVPILLATIIKNQIKIAKYLIEYILSSNIDGDKKVSLLQVYTPSLKTSLYQYAKLSGNKDFVKYLDDKIANSPQLTKIQKKQIFQF